jgi:hypothetical protein
MKAFSSHLKTASIYFSIQHCRNDPQKILRTEEPYKPIHVNRDIIWLV